MSDPDDGALLVARDGEAIHIRANGQIWSMSWQAPPTPPDGVRHGATGVCVTADRKVVLVSTDGDSWDLPGGRPERDETWEQTLRRELLEEACVSVVHARLLGFSRGRCLEGSEQGLVPVRSLWRAAVELGPWEPQFEIPYRRLVQPADLRSLSIGGAYAPFLRRAFSEAGV